jgi:hypothetical protein
MKKRNLLSMALASLALTSASAAEYSIIKDGELAEGIELIAHEGAGDKIEFGKECPGGGTAALYTTEVTYSNVRFYAKDKALDLDNTWVVEVEYYYDEFNEDGNPNVPDDYLSEKWTLLSFGIAEDTVGGVFSPQVETKLDAKFEGTTFRGNMGKVNKDSAYIFTRADKFTNGAKFFTFSFCDQMKDSKAPVRGQQLYIKNLKVVSDGYKPFYAENFVFSGAQIWNNYTYVEKYYINNETLEFEELNTDGGKKNANWVGCIAMSSDAIDFDLASVNLRRLWEPNGTDASLKYYDPELTLALNVLKANPNSTYINNIPVEAIAGKDITIDFLSKWQADAKDETMDEETDPALRALPISVIFDGKVTEAISAVAEGALIEGQWTAYSHKVTIPQGTKVMTIKFASNENFSYCVDNLFLTVADGSYKLSNFAEDAQDPTDVVPGAIEKVVLEDHVASIANDANASAYFDGDNFIVKADEEIASISIIDMAGKTASVNGGEFNVSGFNKGIYVFVAKTVNGASISGKIIIE